MTAAFASFEKKSAHRQAFEHYLRTGHRLTTAEWKSLCEQKFNHIHDPHNGQFTSGSNGAMATAVRQRTAVSAARPKPATASIIASTGTNSHLPIIAPIRGYPEEGPHSWRKANDAIFKDAADEYNQRNGHKPGDVPYMDPKLMKAWAMVETGGNREQFMTDPFQVNKPGDWDDKKTKLGLRKYQAMTPERSAKAALQWLDFKGSPRTVLPNGQFEYHYKGQRFAFERYNANNKVDKNGRTHASKYVEMISNLFHAS